MSNSNVEVVKVETVKAGKTDRIVLHYKAERTKGDTWKVGALAVKLDQASRDKLKSVKPGDIVSAKIVKEGQFYNLASVSDAENSNSAGNPSISAAQNTRNSTGADTNTRIQVMNALTNAVSSLGSGATTKQIKNRVIELMIVVDEVIELASAGDLRKTPEAHNAALADSTDVSVEDDFGDF